MDGQWDGPVRLVENTKFFIKSLAAGDNRSKTYVLRAARPGLVFGHPAEASYRTAGGERVLSLSHAVQTSVVSKAARRWEQAVTVGSYLSLGLLQSYTAWRNAVLLAGGLSTALLGNSLLLKSQAVGKARARAAAEAELLKDE